MSDNTQPGHEYSDETNTSEREKESLDESDVDDGGFGLGNLFGGKSSTEEPDSAGATPTPEAPETTIQDGYPGERPEPRRVELDMPAELGVYDRQRHRNGDETILILSAFGEGWQAIAFDSNAAGEILESEIVGHAPTEKRAVGMCEYWLQANPKGVLGPTNDESGGGPLQQLQQLLGGGQ